MIRLNEFKDRINATPAVETIHQAAAHLRAEIIRQMYRLCIGVAAAVALALLLKASTEISLIALIAGFAMILVFLLFLVTRGILRYLSSAEKHVLEKVSERELLYFDLYDDSPDLLLSVDSNDGRVLQCNRTLLHVLGFQTTEVVGRPILEFYHPSCHEQVQRLFAEFRQNGKIEDAELQIRKKDGTFLDVSLNSSAVRDHQGRILYSRSSWRDITKRKIAENELRVLIEAMPQFVWTCFPN